MVGIYLCLNRFVVWVFSRCSMKREMSWTGFILFEISWERKCSLTTTQKTVQTTDSFLMRPPSSWVQRHFKIEQETLNIHSVAFRHFFCYRISHPPLRPVDHRPASQSFISFRFCSRWTLTKHSDFFMYFLCLDSVRAPAQHQRLFISIPLYYSHCDYVSIIYIYVLYYEHFCSVVSWTFDRGIWVIRWPLIKRALVVL